MTIIAAPAEHKEALSKALEKFTKDTDGAVEKSITIGDFVVTGKLLIVGESRQFTVDNVQPKPIEVEQPTKGAKGKK